MLVMEYVPRSLRSYVEDKKVGPNDTTTSIFLDIAQGLKYLHSQDPPLIHRDLTSNNVLLTEKLQAKIADLGTSKFLKRGAADQTMTNVPGNPSHMPPEAAIADVQRYIQSTDRATKLDVFSFGNVIINVLTGKFPVVENDQGRRNKTEVQRRRNLLEDIGECKEKDLVIRCLNNNPDRRPTTDQLVDFFKGLTIKG